MRIEGVKEQVARFRRLARVLSETARKALLKAGSIVVTEAKTNRFRKIAGANKKQGGRTTVRAVSNILTMRSGTYLRRISQPIEQGRGRVSISARVPYAQRHEEKRPVLTKAIETKRDEVYALVGDKVFIEVEKG